jgi:CheY-like chemotaxis protein
MIEGKAVEGKVMPSINPACFYHPVSIVFLDDDKAFLNALEMQLGKHGGMRVFMKSDEALSAVAQSEEDVNEEVLDLIDPNEDNAISTYSLSIRIANIHRAIYNENRSKYIAGVVVDYDMPISGIDFCKDIKSNEIYKIMLTGKAGNELAIDAFNKRIINKYLAKKSSSLYEDLVLAISDAKQHYFFEKSKTIIDNLGKNFKNLLINDSFQKIFNKVFQESGAVEYYLVDRSGSYLFLDKELQPTWLIIRSVQEIKEQIAILEEAEIGNEFIELLKSNQKLLFLVSENDYEKPEAITEYLFDANKLNDNYFYSVVKGRVTNLIDWENIKTCEN